MGKIAIISGVNGQDGSYLAELLIKKKYKVYGITNPLRKKNRLNNINKIKDKIILKYVDINNISKIRNLIKLIKPNEFYHLAAQSYINYKFEDEFFKLNPNINGTHYILSAIKNFSPKTKFYFAGSSEMFGNVSKSTQNEETKFNPRSAYGVSKVAGFYLTKNYREAYNLFCCTGILYNHESPRRSISFVTRKITHGISLIKKGKINKIILGNINSKRDWGHANEYVLAMWKMLQLNKPDDFVIGTGKLYSVLDFIKIAFKYADLDFKKYIKIEKKLFRPNEKFNLRANISKAKKKLKWEPKISFVKLVHEMVDNDLKF